jgi:H-NS histone family protein
MTKQEEFNIVTKYFNNFASLRAFSKDKELSFLEKAEKNLAQIIQDRKEAIELEKMEQEERERARIAIIEEIEAKGWSVKDLLNPNAKENKLATSKAKNKYTFLDEQGNTQYWTGRGRMPAALKTKIDAGESLESFLIES